MPPLMTTLNVIRCKNDGRSSPYRAKVSCEASITVRFSSSSGVAESNSISALKGSFSAELSRISPRPSAQTSLAKANTSSGHTRVRFRDIVVFSGSQAPCTIYVSAALPPAGKNTIQVWG